MKERKGQLVGWTTCCRFATKINRRLRKQNIKSSCSMSLLDFWFSCGIFTFGYQTNSFFSLYKLPMLLSFSRRSSLNFFTRPVYHFLIWTMPHHLVSLYQRRLVQQHQRRTYLPHRPRHKTFSFPIETFQILP
jgi:hypothetical protein